jgi:hypothetical protein
MTEDDDEEIKGVVWVDITLDADKKEQPII